MDPEIIRAIIDGGPLVVFMVYIGIQARDQRRFDRDRIAADREMATALGGLQTAMMALQAAVTTMIERSR